MFRFYSKPTETNPRVCVVGEHSEGVLKLAVSRCSTKDHFCKKKGRAIAEGRLSKGKLCKEIRMNECDIRTFLDNARVVATVVSKDPRRMFLYTMKIVHSEIE